MTTHPLGIATAHRYSENPAPPPPPPPPPPPEGDYWAEARNVYDVPFESALIAPNSIWTRPIGTGAVYVDAQLQEANQSNPYGWDRGAVTRDREFYALNATDPIRTLTRTISGPGNNDSVRVAADMHAPLDSNGNRVWNNGAAFVRASNPFQVWQGQRLYLPQGGHPSWEWTIPVPHPFPIDLRAGDETTHWGAHGASKLSVVAGGIKPGVLNNDEDIIHHPLKLNVNGARFLYRQNGGFRWPALDRDSGYDDPTKGNYYNGTVPEMEMGSLLALPASYDLSWITEPRAYKIANTLKHYGCYIVDVTSSVWDVYAFSVNYRSFQPGQWSNQNIPSDRAFHEQTHLAITHMHVVNNNAPNQTCSGGGVPIAPNLHAPPVTQ